MAANYVEPLLNHPTDPFLQEQIEEQRRYAEAQAQKRRGDAITDWANRTKIEREYNRQVLEDQRRYNEEQAKNRYDIQRGHALEDQRRERKWARKDKNRSNRERDQASAELGAELPKIRDRLDAINQEETRLKNSLIVDTPGERHTTEAYNNTSAFNRRALQHLKQMGVRQGYVVTDPQNEGTAMSSTQGMMYHLSSISQNPPSLGQTLLQDYQRIVDKEKQSLYDNNARLRMLNTSRSQLINRQDAILQRTSGGDIDYDAFGAGIGPDPNATMVEYDGLRPVSDPAEAADDFQVSNTGYSGLGAVDEAEAKYAQSAANREAAYSGVETMYDQMGNWSRSSDKGSPDNEVDIAFERILNAPAASPAEKKQQLQNEIKEINRRMAALEATYQTDYDEATQDTWHVPNIFGTAIDPTAEEVSDRYTSQETAFNVLKARIQEKINEIDQQQSQMVGHGTMGPVNAPDLSPSTAPDMATPGLAPPPPPPSAPPPPPPVNSGQGGSQPHLW